MAWTTSASLRARPIAWDYAAKQLKTAGFLYACLRRSTSRLHPSFALAVPLATLGLISPLLPAAVTTALLIAAGVALCLVALPEPQPAPIAARDEVQPKRSLPPSLQPNSIHTERTAQQRALIADKLPFLTAVQRESSWSELMSRVNHDLRTPLNAVIGFSELMALELFGPLGDDRYQDYVHHIRDSAADLLKSTEDTLALTALMASPSRRAQFTGCDLDLITSEAWGFLARRAAGRGIELETMIPADLEVMGEARTLRQILVNMLSEAISRAATGERVILSAICEGELVELGVSVSKERTRSVSKDASLPMCLARTLLEMQGTTLLDVRTATAGWRAVTVLDRAAQQDFFGEHHEERADHDHHRASALVS